jgi:hypothetical protein
MPHHKLHFSLQRPVKTRDMTTLLDLLKGAGHDVSLLNRCEGGICFLVDGKDIGKDVRFHVGSQRTSKIYADTDPDKVWLSYTDGLEEYDTANSGWFNMNNRRGDSKKFTPQETEDIECAVIEAFGVLMHTIRNEGRKVEKSDSPRDVNLHFGFDYEEAVKVYVRPDSDFSEERTFHCFKCKVWKNDFSFTWSCNEGYDPELETESDNVLGRFVFRNEPCCVCCLHSMAFRSRQDVKKHIPKRRKL